MSDDDNSDAHGCLCVLVCVIIVVCIAVYRPLSFYPRVESAVLGALDPSTTPPPDSTNAVQYNLSVGLSFSNSHRNVEIQYLNMAVAAFYGNFMLGFPNTTFPTPFRQGPNNKTVRSSSVFLHLFTRLNLRSTRINTQ